MYFASKCIACRNCLDRCTKGAITVVNEKIVIDRSLCAACDEQDCVSDCYTDALKLSAYEVTVKKLFDLIQRDRQYWGSEGGVTLSGGEPLLQIEFAKALLQTCHEAYIHTAIETCGNIPWASFESVLPVLDWIFFDLKHNDAHSHEALTGSDNALILDNARRLSKEFPGRLIFRLPLIPGFNNSDENIDAVLAFVKECGRNEINILPLHHLGSEKYPLLNKTYQGRKFPLTSNEELRKIQEVFNKAGVHCYLGSETPF